MASRVEERSGIYADGTMSGRRFAELIGVPHGTVKRWLHEGMPCTREAHHNHITVEVAKAWIEKRYPRSIAFNRQSIVYFARRGSDGAIKIGFTSDIERRLRELRRDAGTTVVLLACVPGAKPDELAIHDRFAADRLEEEWFRASDSVVAFIASLGRSAA